MTKLIISLVFITMLTSCKLTKTTETSSLTPETQALYTNLKKIAETNILFGHQDDVAYGIGWIGGEFNSDIEKVTGDYPAIFGWDLGHIDSLVNLDSVSFKYMQEWSVKAYEKGGIITVGWHQRNLLTNGSSWDTTRVVDKMLPGGELNNAFNAQLDNIAEFLNGLETKEGIKIPVIFRPYHEHNGGWFWWGYPQCSNKQYKELFRYTIDYLRQSKGIRHMLICYSTDAFDDRDDYLARYPGDDYVDIFGWDDYKSIRTTETRDVFHKRIETVNTLAKEKDKLAALAETGMESVPDSTWWTDIILDGFKTASSTDHIAYMLVWRNANTTHHYAPYPEHPSCENFNTFRADSLILFLNELPELYN